MGISSSKQDERAASPTGSASSGTSGESVYQGQFRPPRVHRQTLVEMNIAVFTARRNAAHQCVIDILRRKMLTRQKKTRRKLYLLCGILLDEAIMCTRRSQLQTSSAVMHYLQLLRDTINAVEALIRHEMKLNQESRELAGVLNQYVVTQMQSANDVFSGGEMNILDCIEDLLKFGDPIIAQDSEDRIEKLTEDDRRRYDLALREYTEYYRRFNVKTPLSEVSGQLTGQTKIMPDISPTGSAD